MNAKREGGKRELFNVKPTKFKKKGKKWCNKSESSFFSLASLSDWFLKQFFCLILGLQSFVHGHVQMKWIRFSSESILFAKKSFLHQLSSWKTREEQKKWSKKQPEGFTMKWTFHEDSQVHLIPSTSRVFFGWPSGKGVFFGPKHRSVPRGGPRADRYKWCEISPTNGLINLYLGWFHPTYRSYLTPFITGTNVMGPTS